MNRSLRYLAAIAPLLLSTFAEAGDRSNVNVYSTAQPAPIAVTAQAPVAFVGSPDAKRGVPTFLGGGRNAKSAGALSRRSPESAARTHLAQHAGRYGLSAPGLATAVVTQVHDTGRGG